MSDPVSKIEDVEDVLSSIRRLVSETGSSSAHDVDPTADGGGDAVSEVGVSKPDALILTSSLRVNMPDTKVAPSDPDDGGFVTELTSLRKAVSGSFSDEREDSEVTEEQVEEAVEATVEVTVEAKGDDTGADTWAPPASDEYYEDEPDEAKTASWAEALGSDDSSAEIIPIEHDARPEGFDDVARSDDVDDTVSSLMLDGDEETRLFDKADSAKGGAWSDEETDTDEEDVAADWTDHDPSADNIDTSVEDGFANVEEITEREADEDRAPSLIEDLGVATFMRSVSETASIPPADGHDQAFAFTPDDADQEEDDMAMLSNISEFDDAAIDEEMLRDMVSEIVRQELSGDLGERITRNVRKLVRREIHRAMLTREFE